MASADYLFAMQVLKKSLARPFVTSLMSYMGLRAKETRCLTKRACVGAKVIRLSLHVE